MPAHLRLLQIGEPYSPMPLDGDHEGFRVLVEREAERVHAVLFRLLPSAPRSLVEDLAQETFLRAYVALPGFEPRHAGSLRAWLVTIATRLALHELRRKCRTYEFPHDPSDPRPDPEASAMVKELGQALRRAFALLRPELRFVVVLREYEGLDYEDMARVLDLPIGTVRSRLSRGRAELRRILRGLGHEPG